MIGDEDEDEDALFDRLAKNLEAVRLDAALARSRGPEGSPEGLAHAEAELKKLAAGLEELRQRSAERDAVTERLQAAVARGEADLQLLARTVEALSQRIRKQAEVIADTLARGPSRLVTVLTWFALVIAVLGGGVAVWTATGREPTMAVLAHQLATRFPVLHRIGLGQGDEPVAADRMPAPAAASPVAAGQTAASAAPAASVDPGETAATAAAIVPAGDKPAPAFPPDQKSTTATTPTETPSTATPIQTASSPAPSPIQTTTPATLPAAQPAPAVSPAATAGTLQSTDLPGAAMPQPIQTTASSPTQPPAAPLPAETAVVPPTTPVAAAPPPQIQSDTQPRDATALPASAQLPQRAHQIVLRATGNTWVRVRRSDGPALLSRNLKSGDTWVVPAESDLFLDTGNASVLELDVDGVATRLTAGKGVVVRNLPLDADLVGSGFVQPVEH